MVFAKKSLGQHFLTSRTIAEQIADAAALDQVNTALEVGPGPGILTRELLKRAHHVVAIEKDPRMITLLEAAFADEIEMGKLKLVEADALDVDLTSLGLRNGEYALAANIPYYITGALLRRFLADPIQPATAVLLVQKEVAARIARDKKESILSLSVKAYGDPVYLRTVSRGFFRPQPGVDSAVLAVRNISRTHFTDPKHEELFFSLVRAGFGQKRKLLRSNVGAVVGKDRVEELFSVAHIPGKARAEDVPLATWLTLAQLATHT